MADFKYNDGGRICAGFTHEMNDCTVRALATAYDLSYEVAHAWLKSKGRQDGKGCRNFVGKMDTFGRFMWQKHHYEIHRSVKGVLKDYPVGTYMVLIKRHVFVIKDSVIHDTGLSKLGSHVTHLWRIS